MEFDRDDANSFSDENWGNVITHEMGHIIGVGTLWSLSGYPTQIVTNNVYQGAKGISVWRNDWGCSGTPPIELDGGPGTAGGHFDEVCFGNMLMTGYLNGGVSNPLSKLSIAALDDMGYDVDYSAADPYTPPSSCCSSGGRVRALGEFPGIGMGRPEDGPPGLGGKLPPGLSAEGRARAYEYGRLKLQEQKETGPKNRIDGDLTFVGDLITSVLFEEDGFIYGVEVIADELL